MNCRELDSLMHSYLDEELVDGERLALESHLSGCDTCARRAEIERHNLNFIRVRADEGTPLASEALKERLRLGLRGEQRRMSARRLVGVGVVAFVVFGFGVAGYRQWHVRQRELFVEEAARRHARQLPLEMVGENEALEAWFGGKLDHRVHVPQFTNAVAAGARLINLRDRDAAYIRYDAKRDDSRGVRQLSLFVFDDSGELELGDQLASEIHNSHGYNVVSWRDGDVVYELVTDLDENDVRALLQAPSVQPARLPARALDVRPASMTNQ